MIYPTLPIEIWLQTGNDVFAQPLFEQQPGERVCPVRLSFKTDTTTVRTDSAGSKGHAREPVSQVVILAVPKTRIRMESKLVIMGRPCRVIEIHPRFTVNGVHDHDEIHCSAWT
jgi:hypothetical protein